MAQLEPMCCYECGTTISDKIEIFRELKAVYLEHQYKQKDSKFNAKMHANKKILLPDPNEEIMPVFEILGLNRLCCRTHINNTVSLNDLNKS